MFLNNGAVAITINKNRKVFTVMIDNFIKNFSVSDILLILGSSLGVFYFLSDFFVHTSCFISKLTKKKICRCWDCHDKCDLYK